jgi:hypothetical protein
MSQADPPPEAQFWDVFVTELPRLPSVDELICRIVAIDFPEGFRKECGGDHTPIIPPDVVAAAVGLVIRAAVADEENAMTLHLRRRKLYAPYSWGLKLSNNIVLTEAVRQVLDALDVEDIGKLNRLFWEAYRRVEASCQEDGRVLHWPPFSDADDVEQDDVEQDDVEQDDVEQDDVEQDDVEQDDNEQDDDEQG